MTDTTHLRNMAKAATSLGPFTIFSVYSQHEIRTPSDTCVASTLRREDARLFMETCNALPDLLDTIDRLTSERVIERVKRLRSAQARRTT